MVKNNPYQAGIKPRETAIALGTAITIVNFADLDDWALYFKRTWRRERIAIIGTLLVAALFSVNAFRDSSLPVSVWMLASMFVGGLLYGT